MLDYNSQNIQTDSACQTKCRKVSLVSNVTLSLLGLVSSIVILIIILISNYLNTFDLNLISNCPQSTGYNYFVKVSVISRIIITETALCIVFFAFLFIFSCFKLKNYKENQFRGFFLYKRITNIILILAAGCLFGNFVKLLVSLQTVLSCTSNWQYLASIYYNFLILAILSGLCLLTSLIIFFSYPCLWRLKKSYYVEREVQNIQNNQHKQVQQQKTRQIMLKYDYGLQMPENSIMNLFEDKKHIISQQHQIDKPKRIFGRTLLAQSKYGFSAAKSTPNKQSSVYQIKKDLLEQNKVNMLNQEVRPVHMNRSHERQKTKSPRASQLEDSYIVNINSQGPPLQLGHYEGSPGYSMEQDKQQSYHRFVNLKNIDDIK